MTPALSALLAGLPLLAGAAAPAIPENPAMSEPPRALSLDVEARDGMLEIRLTGLSDRPQGVSYALEVTGRSTARHQGATRLAAGTPAVLSTMRTAAGDDWCVRLVAEEEGRTPYEITRGPCAARG